MRHSFLSMASLAAACTLVACGRSNLNDLFFSANPTGGVGGEGATGGTAGFGGSGGTAGFGGTGGFGGSGGGIGGTGNVGATGGMGGMASSSGGGFGGSPGFCGDGILSPGEQCDDGNTSSNDSCVACLFAQCGDGLVWFGVEQCDDGNFNTADACPKCQKAICGDGFVWTGVEQCDDGNTNDGDGCSSKCTVELPGCGNGIVDPGEQCDDGNSSSNDACVACTNAKCGDGFVWTGVEQCDDGNLNNGDGCSNACLLPKCGDGNLDPGEECDDGNLNNGDGCSSSCTLSKCGDGFVDPTESCDLGSANADRPALLVKQGSLQFAVRPIDRGANVVTFYAYASASGHTGYEVLQGSRIYFYRDTNTGNLNLVFHHGIDFNVSGQSQPSAQVSWTVAGLPSTVLVLVADDSPSELAKSSPTTVAGKWKLQNNSDGGALGVFPFPGNFTTTIAPTFTGAINSWAWINGDDAQTSLNLTQTVEITAFSTPSACRLDCSIPACGDGILDGGEVCDDGNTIDGDGCAANCASLN